MRTNSTIIACTLITLLCASSCSLTSRMPEGEVLYRGIKEISYGQRAKSAVEMQRRGVVQEEGVITAVANVVGTIDSLLSGRHDVAATLDDMQRQQADKRYSRRQRDSIRAEMAVIRQAYSEAKAEVNAALACLPNGALLGSSNYSSPWSPGLYIHNSFADAKTLYGRWMYDTFAKSPVYLSTVNPRTRVRVARNVLRNHGFFDAEVDYDVLPMRDSLRAKLAYSVYPMRLYRLDRIEYLRFPPVIQSVIVSTLHQSALRSDDAFSVYSLDEEKKRLSGLLRDRGYYNFRPDYIIYKADTLQRSGWVQLHVEPAPGLTREATQRYVLGNTDITLLRYDDYDIVDSIVPRRFRPRTAIDTTSRLARRMRNMRNVKMRYSGTPGRPPLRLSELNKYLSYDKGMPYSASRMDRVQERVSGMGIFSQVQMQCQPRAAADSLLPDTLDVSILAMLDKPYDSEFTADLVNKSNGLLGPGLSYSISKRNAFRRAETLKMKLYGSYEWQTGAGSSGASGSALNSYELGGQISLNYPRLIMPCGRRLSYTARASTDMAIDISWLNRAGYYQMAQFKGELTYKYQARRYVTHSVTPLSLKYTSLLSHTAAFDEVIDRSPVMAVSMRDQLVPSMSYTLGMTSRRDAHNPRAFTMTVKQSGNVTSAIFAALGRPWGERDKRLLDVPFAQFVKLTAEYRHEFTFHRRSSLVGRVMAGAVYSYGNSTTAPYADLFAIGGANSIRAFCLRGVGPGRYSPQSSGYSYIDQMGDCKFELNLEYRFPIVADLHGAVFADAGNVWLMRPDDNRPGSGFTWRDLPWQMALGTGFGLRYDLSFLVLRFDVGVGIHAPYNTTRRGYYNMPDFWDSLGFHLAVGYPF